MAKLEIITVPNKILREEAQKITKIDKKIKRLISDMRKTFDASGGIGLAAPQVGASFRLIIVELKGGKRKNGEDMPIFPLATLINPEITENSTQKIKGEEGCLSIPEIWGTVERSEKIVVEALDENGKKIKIEASNLLARVFQHEIDHLNGVLFTDRVDYSTLHKLDSNGEKIPIKL